MPEQTQRWNIGSAVITTVVEHEVASLPVEMFYPEASGAAVASQPWLVPEYVTAEGLIGLAVRAFVVQIDSRTVVVDPCVGNGKHRQFPLWDDARFPFLDRLAHAGFDPAAVDTVVHTHLHPDHVGWDTRLIGDSWQPTFQNASHLYTQRELDFWKDSAQRESEDVWADSIAPIFDHGLAEIVDEDSVLGTGLRLAPTPGHTPGHVSLWVESEGEVAVISGDVLSHPVQCLEPEWAHVADWDPELGRASRRAFLDTVERRRALLLVNHFPGRCAGHVSSPEASVFEFTPTDGVSVE